MTEELQQQSTANEAPEEMPDEELLYDLADLFKIFSDTTRIKILYALMGRELSVSDIAEATETSQSAVSHQLRILKQSRLVKFRRDGRNINYSLADDHRAGAPGRKKGTTMRKSFKLDEIDCANCARKLEDSINGLEGVESASVNFMTQKLTLSAPDSIFDKVLDRVVKLTADLEPDCEILR